MKKTERKRIAVSVEVVRVLTGDLEHVKAGAVAGGGNGGGGATTLCNGCGISNTSTSAG